VVVVAADLAGLARLGWAGLRRRALFRGGRGCRPGWPGWAGLAFAVELYFVVVVAADLAGLAELGWAGLGWPSP